MSRFTPGAVVPVDGVRVLFTDRWPAGDGDRAESQIQVRDWIEHAWAQWDGASAHPWRVRVTALRCAECPARTDQRCCDIAVCDEHRDRHQAIDHVAPDAGRYAAALTFPEPKHRYAPAPARITGLRYPHRMDMPVIDRNRPGDAIRVFEHIRMMVLHVGSDHDPIGAALRDLVHADGTLPTPARTRWIVSDILARCTWPAMADALGDTTTARWLRRQPPITGKTRTPLSERIYSLDINRFDIRNASPTWVGELAATDALCDLWRMAPHTVARGALGFTGQVATEIFSHALTLPSGPERVGAAIAQAQRDAITTAVNAIQAAQ